MGGMSDCLTIRDARREALVASLRVQTLAHVKNSGGAVPDEIWDASVARDEWATTQLASAWARRWWMFWDR